MSEFFIRRRIPAVILLAAGALGLQGCSSHDTVANKLPSSVEQGSGLPPLAVPGQIMHCRTLGPNKSLTAANLTVDEMQQIASVFRVTTAEMEQSGRAFVSTCDASLTGNIVTHYGEIPKMAGDPLAAGKECVIWEALYPDYATAQADKPLNSFIIVCDPSRLEGRRSSPTGMPAQTAHA